MSTQISPLVQKLRDDLAAAQAELADVEQRGNLLRWKLQYIQTLLDSATAAEEPPPRVPAANLFPKPFRGLTIADTAARVLQAHGEPLSCMEIAKRAMAGGFEAEHVERARSHFSAVISKDINGGKPRFRQVDRGLIGLAEWAENGRAKPSPAPAKVAAENPFGEDEQFKDEDIPF